MRRLVLLVALAAAAPASAEDGDPLQAAFVDVVAERDTWYVGEYVRLEIRVGYDAAYFDAHVLQPFQRELDVPVEIAVPWLAGRAVTRTEFPTRTLAVAMNGESWVFQQGHVTEARGQRSFEVVRTPLTFPVATAEEIDPSAEIRFTYADEFREDFVEGRVAVNPQLATIRCAGELIRVLPLPDEGRPAEFSGVVGTCTIEARLDDSVSAARGLVHVAVTVRADVPFAPDRMPVLTGIDGVHVGGVRKSTEEGGMRGNWFAVTAHHELKVLDPELRAIPAIAFTFFDPVAAEYRTVRTDPVPLPASVIAEVTPESSSGADVSAGGELDAESGGAGLLVVCGVLAMVLLLVGGVVVRRRSSSHDESKSALDRAAAAARAELEVPGADAGDVLAAYLAQHLGCAPAAVVSPDLSRRLQAAGFDAERAQRTAALLERLVSARYGGAPLTDADRVAVRAVLEER